jgi:hypothetical protein
LLVINDAVLERGLPAERNAEFVVKHMMKAIIGHGDALLFAHGMYHASYLEKQKRMRALSSVVPGIARLYEEAAEFRFEPRYARYLGNDLLPFIDGARSILSQAHLSFERFRSGEPHCTFRNHARRILLTESQGPTSFVAMSKQMLRSWSSTPCPMGLSPAMQTAVRRSHPRKLLAAVLPTVLYGPTDDDSAQLVQALLGAKGTRPNALREAYLSHWAKYGDPNFHTTAKQLGLLLDSSRHFS